MKLKINNTVVNLHENTFLKIKKIMKEKKLNLSKAVSFCLEKVN